MKIIIAIKWFLAKFQKNFLKFLKGCFFIENFIEKEVEKFIEQKIQQKEGL